MSMQKSTEGSSLGEILEKILDKGVVIAGDISISLADVELITIKIRLVVASVDKAMEMGINWWKDDPYLSSSAKKKQDNDFEEENKRLKAKLSELEQKII
jgi:hypothetical protein